MVARIFFNVCAVLGLAGCVSFQDKPINSQISYPLAVCDKKQLDAAVEAQRSEAKELQYNNKWVCVTPPLADGAKPVPAAEKPRLELQALNNPAEILLRETLEDPLVINKKGQSRPVLGVALSGGGTKAATVAMGVLQGLSDNQLLDTAAYVSTVSGGSYAGYFYFSHKVFAQSRQPRNLPPLKTADLFADCLWEPDFADDPVYAQMRRVGSCKRLHFGPSTPDTPKIDNRYQAYLRCTQDIFNPGKCSTRVTSGMGDFSLSPYAVLGTVTLFPVSNITSTLFDWGIGVSPSAKAYHDGIGVTFGSSVTNLGKLTEGSKGDEARILCQKDGHGDALDCLEKLVGDPNPVPMTFDELREAYLAGARDPNLQMPFWIINATAPRRRSGFGWFTLGDGDPTNSDMFEMTAVSHGSGRYGYVSAPTSLYSMTVLDAVAASAAFFDSNQMNVAKTNGLAKGFVGILQHVSNLDWGADIPNYNVSDGRRNLHRVLPFPFYWLDSGYSRYLTDANRSDETQDRARSAFIRLIDGGNAENLGVYSLLKRGVQTILIADSAEDPHGYFDDICGVANRLEHVPGEANVPARMYMPGLSNFAAHCKNGIAEKSGYNLHAWPFEFPVLVGCIRMSAPADATKPCQSLNPDKDVRLLVVKPAINVRAFYSKQTYDRAGDPDHKWIKECWMPGVTFTGGMPLLNCETADFIIQNKNPDRGDCQVFPQHTTAGMTVNSSATLFGAYRELARQYVWQANDALGGLLKRDATPQERAAGIAAFERIADQQSRAQYQANPGSCTRT